MCSSDLVAAQADAIGRSRAEQGCIEYVIAADPVDPGRAVLFERWASQADLDAHLAALRATPPIIEPDIEAISSSITIYDVSGERQLGR